MHDIPIIPVARQDALLKDRTFVRPHVMSVQATAATEPLLKLLAGVPRPERHAFYEVRVKRDSIGRLQVDASAEQVRDSLGRLVATVEYAAQAPARRFRVEVRQDETWLFTLLIDAPDEASAHDEALARASVFNPGADFDVWSITEEDQALAENEGDHEFPAAGVGSTAGLTEPGSVAGAAPGGVPVHPADPGSSRRSTPAFAASPRGEFGLSRLERDLLAPFSAQQLRDLALSGSSMNRAAIDLLAMRANEADREKLSRGLDPAVMTNPAITLLAIMKSWRCNRERDIETARASFEVHDRASREPFVVEIPMTSYLENGGDLTKHLLKRFRVDLRLTPLPEFMEFDWGINPEASDPAAEAEAPPPARKLSRIYKLRLAPDRVGFVEFYAFQDERLPSPSERADLREEQVSHLEVREMITRLHLAEDISPLAVP
jgi:hypothetical protein